MSAVVHSLPLADFAAQRYTFSDKPCPISSGQHVRPEDFPFTILEFGGNVPTCCRNGPSNRVAGQPVVDVRSPL